jgi:hypothetical protein
VPNIREFPTPALDIRPTETGIEAQAGAARRIGAFYNQAGEAISRTGQRLGGAVRDAGDVYVKYQDHKEISAGAANGAAIVNGLTTQWNETVKNANPNDPSVAARFRDETMEPAFQKFQQGFTTERSQQWAEHFVDTYRQHMFVKTSADMSKLAGDAVQLNALKSANSFGNTVYNDPSSLGSNRKLARLALDGTVGSSPTIDGVTGAKIRGEMGFKTEQHLVNSAIEGTIDKGGDWKKIADDPKNAPFINQQAIDKYEKAAKRQQHADDLAAKQAKILDKQENVSNAHAAANKNMADNVSIDPATGRANIKPDFFKRALDIAKMPDAPDGLSRTLIDWGQHQQTQKREAIVSDPVVTKDLDDRLFSADNPTTRIDLMKAQIAGKLSDHDFNVRSKLITELEDRPLKGPVWQSTMKAVESELVVNVPGIPGKDNTGLVNYSKFVQSFIPQYQALERAGKVPPNALDVKDPESMISKAMAPFRRSQAQRMQDYVSAAGGLRVGGEVPAAPAAAATSFENRFNAAFGSPAATGTPPAKPITGSPATTPDIGATRVGNGGVRYRFKGGDQFKKESWEKIE